MKMKKEILHLTLKKKWFDLIASGKKKVVYREIKPYWKKRLLERSCMYSGNSLEIKEFDEIHFRNGYMKDSPLIRVKWNGLEVHKTSRGECFAILLGDVLEKS